MKGVEAWRSAAQWGMRTVRSLKSPWSARAWQAMQLAGLLMAGRCQTVADSSSCWRVNHREVVIRSWGGTSRARLPVSALEASQADSCFTHGDDDHKQREHLSTVIKAVILTKSYQV